MNLKEYIEKLTLIYEEHGNIDLIYSIDDEGNKFSEVIFDPETVLWDGEDTYSMGLSNESDDRYIVCCIN